MSYACRTVKFRLSLRPQEIIWALIGVGCVRAGLAFEAAGDPFDANPGATAGLWISGGSLILLALLDWEVRQHHPGMTSLFRRYSCGAIAGSLLPVAASQVLSAVPALAATLAGLALTLCSAMLFEWLLRPVRQDGPLPSEGVVIARLTALSEILKRAA